ncbi:MAG: XisI protein [Saprospiraceae bacterium]|nr:XisI protein [Saprospiraceae bacterium]
MTLLEREAAIKLSNAATVQRQAIADLEKNHFLLASVGWARQKFYYAVSLHFDIIDDKVWIQQNNTEILVADELMDLGVEREDIVLGFLPAYARQHSGFAVV